MYLNSKFKYIKNCQPCDNIKYYPVFILLLIIIRNSFCLSVGTLYGALFTPLDTNYKHTLQSDRTLYTAAEYTFGTGYTALGPILIIGCVLLCLWIVWICFSDQQSLKFLSIPSS